MSYTNLTTLEAIIQSDAFAAGYLSQAIRGFLVGYATKEMLAEALKVYDLAHGKGGEK